MLLCQLLSPSLTGRSRLMYFWVVQPLSFNSISFNFFSRKLILIIIRSAFSWVPVGYFNWEFVFWGLMTSLHFKDNLCIFDPFVYLCCWAVSSQVSVYFNRLYLIFFVPYGIFGQNKVYSTVQSWRCDALNIMEAIMFKAPTVNMEWWCIRHTL